MRLKVLLTFQVHVLEQLKILEVLTACYVQQRGLVRNKKGLESDYNNAIHLASALSVKILENRYKG